MDWPQDNFGVSEKDRHTVFKFDESTGSAVIEVLRTTEYTPEFPLERNKPDGTKWTLDEWIEKKIPRSNGDDGGLVLVLAKRRGEPPLPSKFYQNSTTDWAKFVGQNIPWKNPGESKPDDNAGGGKGAAPLVAKLKIPDYITNVGGGSRVGTQGDSQREAATQGDPQPEEEGQGGSRREAGAWSDLRREVRTLPFSNKTFESLAKRMYVHGSISRVISRGDVPVITADRVEMNGQPAYVYNCRSSNAWAYDIAVSVTYFPRCGMTYAIVYGCHYAVAEEFIKRIPRVRGSQIAHPLLVPGIFVELERARHDHLVKEAIWEAEIRILETEALLGIEVDGSEAAESANRQKRRAWFDMVYLRNSLLSWDSQLAKVVQHVEEIDAIAAKEVAIAAEEAVAAKKAAEAEEAAAAKKASAAEEAALVEEADPFENATARSDTPPPPLDIFGANAASIGHKIRNRIQVIREEYADWSRGCTLRLEGMVMGTQWSQGETSVEIAFDTKRDSKHMRSISLLTMVFLPGTFLATVFSMTFFDWRAASDGTGQVVSVYIWLYFFIAIILTLITVAAWYFFVIFRPRWRRRYNDDDDDGEDKGV